MNDDYGFEKCWSRMTELLSDDEGTTIRYLENYDAVDLYWISEIFEDISVNLKSQKFIDYLRKLDKKFPELEITQDIYIAERYF
ncbi:hypothetical protein CAX48_12580 [Listeria monocytogenes]|nr:hypothetical protein [Listeria monocytogenes]EAD1187790.1 hypothetical protein [Listeria monocytogenes]EAD3240102.1 hypothetical protein [Listeria monocytogenes]EAE2396318.1 hypothetical protein [Listeria monocytogenes]EAE6306522.1 hypothetical protein [Listeria monocytogenes]